jgi:hypothetical protein
MSQQTTPGGAVTRFAALLVFTWTVGGPVVHAQTTLNRWIQFGTGGTVLARAITTGTTCPALSVDGTAVAMAPRAAPSQALPVLECEASLPMGGSSAVIDGVALKLPVAHPRRIVVVGDTGCRVVRTVAQACNDPLQFPLARIATFAAAFSPDLIVHVGDYYYREAACPPWSAGDGATTGCGGSPHGDAWAAWNADWFSPAQPLMAAAPIALTRGNHESCERGAVGWFTLLDPSPYNPAAVACTAGSAYDFTAPYVVQAGDVALLMFDSSYANDFHVTKPSVATYQAQLDAILPQLPPATILVTHKPAYGLISSKGTGADAVVQGGDADEQSLFAAGVPQPIKLLLSGHIHNYQAVQVSDPAYAPQLVVGNSGTLLDPQFVPATTAGATYSMPGAGTTASLAGTADQAEFGFAVLDVIPGGFIANLFDLNGLPHGHCVVQLPTRKLACTG